MAAGQDFTVQVTNHVVSLTIYSNATDPTTENLGRITIDRTTSQNQIIWVYIVVDSNPQQGDAQYSLGLAACGNWGGVQNADLGDGGLIVRAVIAGNLTNSLELGDGSAQGGLKNLLVGGNITGGIISGSQGVCRIRALGGINANIDSAVGIALVQADTGNLVGTLLRASSGSIDVINVPNGNIGNPAPAAINYVITSTTGIGTLSTGGSVSAGISVGGGSSDITTFDSGSYFRGTMNFAAFTNFHIGGDLLGSSSVIGLNSSLAANRTLDIDGSTASGSQIIIVPSAGLLGQININRTNGGGAWSGTVQVGSTTLSTPGYTNTAASLGGGSTGKVPFALHDESCSPANGETALTACSSISPVRLRHYGRLSWNPAGADPVTITRRAACSGASFGSIPGLPAAQPSFAIDSSDTRTLVVTYPFQVGYEYKITPTSTLKCDTPGNPSVAWDGDYMFIVMSSCTGDVDDNGVVDTDDLFLVINAWGTCASPPCASDIFPSPCGNGVIDTDDLFVVINGWGDCPACDEGGESMMSGEGSGSLPEWLQECLAGCGEDGECVYECILEHLGD